jgi:hypothetical protein
MSSPLAELRCFYVWPTPFSRINYRRIGQLHSSSIGNSIIDAENCEMCNSLTFSSVKCPYFNYSSLLDSAFFHFPPYPLLFCLLAPPFTPFHQSFSLNVIYIHLVLLQFCPAIFSDFIAYLIVNLSFIQGYSSRSPQVRSSHSSFEKARFRQASGFKLPSFF